MKSRNWMGTIWTEDEVNKIRELDYKYLLISDDDHTEAGQWHKHCLVIFKNKHVRPKIGTVHWEKPGSLQGARKYCVEKGPNFYERGTFNICTRDKGDWNAFVDALKTSPREEITTGVWSQMYAHYRGYSNEIITTYQKPKRIEGELLNVWLWGPAGTGKTKWAWDNYPGLYLKSLNKWWDGYTGEDVALIDDWDPKMIVLTAQMKHWADRYPFRAEIKGGSFTIRPKLLIVTSNYSIDQCFNVEDREAIHRRFSEVYIRDHTDLPPKVTLQ